MSQSASIPIPAEEEEVDLVAMFLDYVKDKPNRDEQTEKSLLESILTARLERTKSSNEVMQLSAKVEDCKETMKLYARYQRRMNEMIGHKNCQKSIDLQRKLRLERGEYKRVHKDYAQLYYNYKKDIDLAQQQHVAMLRLEEDISKENKSRQTLKESYGSVKDGFSSLLTSKSRDMDDLLHKRKLEMNAIFEECEKTEAATRECEEQLSTKSREADVLKDIIKMIPSCSLVSGMNSNLNESII